MNSQSQKCILSEVQLVLLGTFAMMECNLVCMTLNDHYECIQMYYKMDIDDSNALTGWMAMEYKRFTSRLVNQVKCGRLYENKVLLRLKPRH